MGGFLLAELRIEHYPTLTLVIYREREQGTTTMPG